MNDYNYDYDIHDYGNSDEDTEDASETESMKYQNDDGYGYGDRNVGGGGGSMDDSTYEIKEQIYQDKLAQLKDELIQLEKGTHPEYLRGLESLNKDYEERLFFIDCNFKLELGLISNEFKNEQFAADKEFCERKIELTESLINDLEEKKKIDTDSACELTNDPSEPKTLTTRKLRRRPNDPIPLPDRRRRTPPAQINYLLDDATINDDLKLINKLLYSKSSGGRGNSSSSKSIDVDNSNTDARIEYGKLFYEKKWFHRGQNIYLESNDDTVPASIIHICNNEIFVKKSNDSSKIKVTLNDLLMKKYSIQRR